jgi:hypothetical protein
MALESSGNLLVGRTSYAGPLSSVKGCTINASGQVIVENIRDAGASFYSHVFSAGTNSVTNIQFARNGAYAGSIATDSAGVTSLIATSDRRLKTGIGDAPHALPKLAQILVREYTWLSSGQYVSHGVIAQELASVLPDAVFPGEDAADGSVGTPWGVDLVRAVPLCIKAIQEQQAIIESLTQRIAALEAK